MYFQCPLKLFFSDSTEFLGKGFSFYFFFLSLFKYLLYINIVSIHAKRRLNVRFFHSKTVDEVLLMIETTTDSCKYQ